MFDAEEILINAFFLKKEKWLVSSFGEQKVFYNLPASSIESYTLEIKTWHIRTMNLGNLITFFKP